MAHSPNQVPRICALVSRLYSYAYWLTLERRRAEVHVQHLLRDYGPLSEADSQNSELVFRLFNQLRTTCLHPEPPPPRPPRSPRPPIILALRALPLAQRDVLALQLLGKFNIETIAKMHAKPLRVTASLLLQARRRLREHIDRQHGGHFRSHSL